MIYTIGRRDIYEPYMDSDPEAAKGKGGSVWKTRQDAAKHISENFSIYGLDADWEKDTVPDGDWNKLLRNAKLIKL